MVCQNQSIDDSDAPLARDLRLLVRERLTAGDSDEQVLDFLVARYGEFVLLKPRFEWHTALALAHAGCGIAGRRDRHVRRGSPPPCRRRADRRRSAPRKSGGSARCWTAAREAVASDAASVINTSY